MKLAVKDRADYADVFNYLGIAQAEQEHYADAEAAFRRALDINPDYGVSRLNLAFTLAEQGRDAEAIDLFRQILEREPENQPARTRLEELQSPRREKERARAAGETRG
jgi:cytochrome c-type biogenesis protein CcmH/NrfG